MKTTEYIAHSEKLATALLAFQTATGIEKTNLKAVYLAMPQLSAPEHDADIVAEAHAGNRSAMALLHMSA